VLFVVEVPIDLSASERCLTQALRLGGRKQLCGVVGALATRATFSRDLARAVGTACSVPAVNTVLAAAGFVRGQRWMARQETNAS
jgi:hypothetical protein